MNNPQKAITNAIEELGAELGISGGFWRQDEDIEDKDPVIASRHHHGKSREARR